MNLPLLLLVLPSVLLAQRSPCSTSSDCVSPHAPHCSQWGWCEWPRELALDLGQCRTNVDCSSRFPICSSQGNCRASESLAQLEYVDPPPRTKELIHPMETRKNQHGSRVRQTEHVNSKQNTGGSDAWQTKNKVQRSHIRDQSSHTSRVVSTRNLLNFNTIVSPATPKPLQNRFTVINSQVSQNFPPKTLVPSTSVKLVTKTTTLTTSLTPSQRQFTPIPAVPKEREIIRRRVLTQKSGTRNRLQSPAPPASETFQTVFLPTATTASSKTTTSLAGHAQFTPIPAVPNFQNLDYDYPDYPEIDRDSRNNEYDIQEKVDDYDYYDYGIAAKEILKNPTQPVFTNKRNKNKYLVQKLFSHKPQQRSNNKELENPQSINNTPPKRTNPRQTIIALPPRQSPPSERYNPLPVRHSLSHVSNSSPRRGPTASEAQDPSVSRGCLYDCVYECVAIEQQEAYKACVKFCGDTCE